MQVCQHINIPHEFILASASRAQAELLRAVGYSFRRIPATLEKPRATPGESVSDYAVRAAEHKAREVALHHPNALILAADTALTFNDEIMGKPRDLDDAVAMIQKLAGHTHRLCSGIAIRVPASDQTLTGVDEAQVTFHAWPAERIVSYVQRTRPLSYAGGYALQGGRRAVDQAHRGRSHDHYRTPHEAGGNIIDADSDQYALKQSEALCPPKPRELFRQADTSTSRAVFGT